MLRGERGGDGEWDGDGEGGEGGSEWLAERLGRVIVCEL